MDLENAYFAGVTGTMPDPQDYVDHVVDHCPECGEAIWMYQDDVLYNRDLQEVIGCTHCTKVDPVTFDVISKIDGEVIAHDDDAEFLLAQEVYDAT